MLMAASMMVSATADEDRQWAVTRPSRGSFAAVHSAAQPPAGWDRFAACVEERESKGNPAAVNEGSGAAGLHQWLPAWSNGLPYNVASRLVEFGVPPVEARQIRVSLSDTPIHRWPAMYQRVGFADQIDRPGGWRHWSLPGSRCERYVP